MSSISDVAIINILCNSAHTEYKIYYVRTSDVLSAKSSKYNGVLHNL